MRSSRKFLSSFLSAVLPVVAAIGIFAAFWTLKTGAQIGPEAIVEETIARGKLDLLWSSWVKFDFSHPSSLPETGRWPSPVAPLVRGLLGLIGWNHWTRGNFVVLLALAACPAILAWAVSLPPWLAGGAVLTLLLVEPTRLMDEVILGQNPALTLAGFLVAVGFLIRRRPRALGLTLGILVWIRWENLAFLPAFLLADAVQARFEKKKRSEWVTRRLLTTALLAALAILPLSIVSVVQGGSFWGQDQTSAWLGGRGVATQWFPTTDSGWATYNRFAAYDRYDQWTRQRWNEFITPWIGAFWIETLTMGFIIAIAVFSAIFVPRTRPLIILALCLMPFLMSIGSAEADLFDRRLFLPLDALLITAVLIGIAQAVAKGRTAWIAVGGLWILWVTWPGIVRTGTMLISVPSQTPWLSGPTPLLAGAVNDLNSERQPLLAAPGQGRALAYFLPNQPIIELPLNWAQEGLLDQLITRYAIQWTTVPGELLRERLKSHAIEIRSASNGQMLYRVSRIETKPPSAAPSP